MGIGCRVAAEQRIDVDLSAAETVRRERERKIHAAEQRAGIHPSIGFVRVTCRRLALVQRLADPAGPLHEQQRDVHFRADGPGGGRHQLKRRLDLGAICFLRPEFRRINHRVQDFANVAVGFQERLRHAVHQRGGRIIGNEALRQLVRNMVRRVRIARQNVEDFLAVFHSALVNLVSEHGLHAGVMEALFKEKFRIAPRLPDAPSGERLRDVDDVILRVSAIHAERVQFHQLAPVILIQAALLFRFRICVGIVRISIRRRPSLRKSRPAEWPASKRSSAHLAPLLQFLLQFLPGDGIGGEPVVQEKQHRGTLGRGSQQIAEFPHGVRADRVAFIFGDEPAVGALGGENVEVVVPEIHHHFLQLALAVNGARHLGHGKLGDNALRQANLLVVDHAIAEPALPLPLPFPFRADWHSGRCPSPRNSACACASAICMSLCRRPVFRFAVAVLRVALHGRLHGRPHLFLLLFPVFLDGYAFAARGELRLGKFVQEFCGGHFQRGKTFEARIESGIINRIRMQLLVDPFLQTHFLHAFEVARARPKTQAIERLQDGFVLGQGFRGQTLQTFEDSAVFPLLSFLSAARKQIRSGECGGRQKQNHNHSGE